MAITPVIAAHAANLSLWLIRRPGAHPFWQWWVVSVVHLRDMPDAAPAARLYEKAQYEFVIYAIDPHDCPEPDPEKPEQGYPHLIPLDVLEQFHGVTDEQARQLTAAAVSSIVDGLLSPDEDDRPRWQKWVATKVQSMRSGNGN